MQSDLKSGARPYFIGQLVGTLLHVRELIAHVCVICHGCWEVWILQRGWLELEEHGIEKEEIHMLNYTSQDCLCPRGNTSSGSSYITVH